MKSEHLSIFKVFSEKIKLWLTIFIDKTPNILLALLVFLLGFYCARMTKNIVLRILKSKKVKQSATVMIGNLISIFTVTGFLLIALNILNLDTMLQALLAGAGVAGLAIGLALQGTLSNTFSGIVLSFTKDIRINDQIETNGFIGTIEDINLRVVKLKTPDGNVVILPNKSIIENPIKNYSSVENSNIILTCGVEYKADLEHVREIAVKAIVQLMKFSIEENNVVFFYTEFSDSAINFELRFLAPSKNLLEIALIKSDAIITIKKAFDANNINIPFPIRTLDIPKDFMNSSE